MHQLGRLFEAGQGTGVCTPCARPLGQRRPNTGIRRTLMCSVRVELRDLRVIRALLFLLGDLNGKEGVQGSSP